MEYYSAIKKNEKKPIKGTSLVVQWLRLCASTAGGMGSIPGQGIKILHGLWCSQKTNQQTKKPRNNAICSNMDATRDYHTKCSKSERERQIPYDTTYTWNLMNLSTKQKQGHGEQTCGCQGGGGWGREWSLGLLDANYYIENG